MKFVPSHDQVPQSEGDVNLSSSRVSWQSQHLDEKTLDLLAQDARYFLHQALSSPCLNALSGSDGIFLVDTQGRRYMDFHGNNVHQVGFGHPKVKEAIYQALEVLPFCTRRYTNKYAVGLAKKLAELSPGTLNKCLFAPGGAEAISMAIRLARMATGRFKTISMWDSFHGATLDTISIGAKRSSVAESDLCCRARSMFLRLSLFNVPFDAGNAATCSVRSTWNTYSVRRGTLPR